MLMTSGKSFHADGDDAEGCEISYTDETWMGTEDIEPEIIKKYLVYLLRSVFPLL
jgi:hypothetical protein